MKNIYTIYEGILNDIDDTISKTDSFIDAANAEFKILQAVVTKPKMYNKLIRRMVEDYRVGIEAPNL